MGRDDADDPTLHDLAGSCGVAGRTDGPHPGEALGDQTSGMSMEAMSASMPAPTSAIIAARAFALAPA